MNPLSFIYQEVLFRPLFNLLVGITNILPTHSIGWAIFFVTVITRLVLLPSALHQAKQQQKNQTKMGALQAELAAVQKKYKGDAAKKAEATMALYRKAGINPVSGCLPLLIQLPILIALYRVFLVGLGPETFHHLYSFVATPDRVGLMFFGVNLTQPSIYVGILAGISQFIQMRFFAPAPPAATGMQDTSAQMMVSMQRNMMYIFPVMTVFIALQLPAALALYWLVSTVLAVAQQYIVKKTLHLEANPTTV